MVSLCCYVSQYQPIKVNHYIKIIASEMVSHKSVNITLKEKKQWNTQYKNYRDLYILNYKVSWLWRNKVRVNEGNSFQCGLWRLFEPKPNHSALLSHLMTSLSRNFAFLYSNKSSNKRLFTWIRNSLIIDQSILLWFFALFEEK